MKALFGMCILVLLGFIVFVVLSGFGLAIAITLKILPWWHIALGTVAGMVMVLLYLLASLSEKDKQ